MVAKDNQVAGITEAKRLAWKKSPGNVLMKFSSRGENGADKVKDTKTLCC